jgi:hypothetical protein
MKSLGSNACAYNSLYVLLPGSLNQMRGITPESTPPLDFIQHTRRHISYVATLLWCLGICMCLFGRAPAGLSPVAVLPLRLACLFVLLFCMFIPQVVWMSSVVSQDYLLIPLLSSAFVSLFFRVRMLSLAMLTCSLIAASSKVVYLIPGCLIATLYFAVPATLNNETRLLDRKLPQTIRKYPSRILWTLYAFAVVGTFVLLRTAIHEYCTESNCYGIETASIFGDPTGAIHELKSMVASFYVLSLPHLFLRDSAFAHFG